MTMTLIKNKAKLKPCGVLKAISKSNLVPRVLSYPPYVSVGRVGENPGNEVVQSQAKCKRFRVKSLLISSQSESFLAV